MEVSLVFALLAAVTVTRTVSGTTTAPLCDDIDHHACELMHSTRPDLCNDTALAMSACRRFCNLCPIVCYHCIGSVTDYRDCNTTKLCAAGEACMIKQLVATSDGHREYAMTCEPAEACDGTGLSISFVGRREIAPRDLSVDCCSDDLCNYPAAPGTVAPYIGTAHPTPHLTSSPCADTRADCKTLGAFYCNAPYLDFARQFCKKSCNLCVTATTSPEFSPATSGWQLLLKGVSGAPGPDLWGMWHSYNTLNTNQPLASHLTTEYNGHYKPDLSNRWNDICLDQMKVSIYNKGMEKAYIVFNATGADKNSWFTPDRIIASTWTDIKSATHNYFGMPGDPDHGRQFYASGHSSTSDKCDSYGWMMVSTRGSCFYEQGDQKPTFYYAPGTSMAHWGFTNPASGDVFAIQGHSESNCRITQHPPHTTTEVCHYKGNTFTQGQQWNDGCKYRCVCKDASTGWYNCRNLCPEYNNLPVGCRLVTQAGECCPIPDCGPDHITTTPNSTFFDGGGCMKDILFLVDEASSHHFTGTNHMVADALTFITNLVRDINVGPTAAQVSLATFSRSVHKQFELDKYHTSQDVMHALSQVHLHTSHHGHASNGEIQDALAYLLHGAMTTKAGDRTNVPDVVVIITDSASVSDYQTLIYTGHLYRLSHDVITIEIGHTNHDHDRGQLATDPAHAISVASSQALLPGSIKQHILPLICA